MAEDGEGEGVDVLGGDGGTTLEDRPDLRGDGEVLAGAGAGADLDLGGDEVRREALARPGGTDEIEHEVGGNDYLKFAAGSMQGWRLNMVSGPPDQFIIRCQSLGV